MAAAPDERQRAAAALPRLDERQRAAAVALPAIAQSESIALLSATAD
ncbi:MAG: hypothetical protein HC895_09970 [Leptolyngbyaceae cyanobacterium SM1_3_5]|nr:hypothetical protein [Leptolyngbyaceae cyanobacterium SM1_3_5]